MPRWKRLLITLPFFLLSVVLLVWCFIDLRRGAPPSASRDRLLWLGIFIQWPAHALIWFWNRQDRRAKRRLARGLCPVCGYDLRATPGRCPECGTLPVTKEA
jgi:hypothetical protein